MPGNQSNIKTSLSVDVPLHQNADYKFDADERQYIDNQILAVQQHLVNALIKGTHASYYKVDASSPTISIGDCVCLASTSGVSPTITKATSAPLSEAGTALGVAITTGSPNGYCLVAVGGIVGTNVTGLAAATGIGIVSSTSRVQTIAAGAFDGTQFALGYVDSAGVLCIGKIPGVSSAGVASDLTLVGQTEGDFAVFHSGHWVPFHPGVAGTVVTSVGASTLPVWAAPSSAPTGAAGGILAGTFPNPSDLNLSGQTRGDILARGASAWQRFATSSTAGYVLRSNGPAADNSWTPETTSVTNITAAAALTNLYDGQRVWVESVRSTFTYFPSQPYTADNITIVNVGGGQLVRSKEPHIYWALQATWYIDSSAGNDENSGLTSGAALATWAEFYRRTTNQILIGSAGAVTVNVLNALSSTDPMDMDFILGGGVSIFIKGTRTNGTTGTFTALTAQNPATNQRWQVTDSGLSGGWASYVGSMIHNTTHGGYFWVVQDLGGGVAAVSEPMNTLANSIATLSSGDAYRIETPTSAYLGRMDIGAILSSNPAVSQKVQIDGFHFLSAGLNDFDYVNIAEARIQIYECKFDNAVSTQGSPTSLSNSSALLSNNYFGGSLTVTSSGAGWTTPQGGFIGGSGGLSVLNGGVCAPANAEVLVTATAGSGVNIQNGAVLFFQSSKAVGIFNCSIHGIDILPNGVVDRHTGGLIWGSGNTGVGINVGHGGVVKFVNTPVITGTAGDFYCGNTATNLTVIDSDVNPPQTVSIAQTWANFATATPSGFGSRVFNPNNGATIVNVTNFTGTSTAASYSIPSTSIVPGSRGSVLVSNASTSTWIAPSTAGYVFQTNGTGADPTWVPTTGLSVTLAGDTTGPSGSNTVVAVTGAAGSIPFASTAAVIQWAAGAANVGSGQTRIASGAGSLRIDRTQAAAASGTNAAANWDFVIGLQTYSGSRIGAFSWGQENTVGAAYDKGLTLYPISDTSGGILEGGIAAAGPAGFRIIGANISSLGWQISFSASTSGAGRSLGLVGQTSIGSTGGDVFVQTAAGSSGANASSFKIKDSAAATKLKYSEADDAWETSVPWIGDSSNNEPKREGYVEIDVSGGGTFTLTAAQYANSTIIITGSPAAPTTVLFPAVLGYHKMLANLSSQTLNFKTVGGAINFTLAASTGRCLLFTTNYGGNLEVLTVGVTS